VIGARVETRRLSAMGQGESTRLAPPHRSEQGKGGVAHAAAHLEEHARASEGDVFRGVALQVELERQILKPGIYLIGYRLWV
jgi:hypothetical protein